MRATCQRYRRWLTTQDPRGAARAAEHVAGCGECAELLELYTGGVAGLRGVAAAVVSPRRVQSFLLRADHATAEEADAAYGAVARRYQRGTDALIGAVAEEPEVSAVRRFVAAADERFRPRFQEPARWRWSWALPLAAAAAAAVVVALWVGAPQDEPRVARPGGSSQLRVAEVAGSVTMAGATGMEALALGGEVLAGRTLTTSREGALGLRDH